MLLINRLDSRIILGSRHFLTQPTARKTRSGDPAQNIWSFEPDLVPWLSGSLTGCLSHGFSDNFCIPSEEKVRKRNSEIMVSENISAILDRRENFRRRILFLACSRVTFAVFHQGLVCFSTESTRASNRCNDYRFYESEFDEKFS